MLQGTTLTSLAKKLSLSVPKKLHSPYSLELFALDKTDFDVVDIQIHEDSPWNGQSIAQLHIPDELVISSMVRDHKIITPRGHTVLQNDDILFIMGPPNKISELGLSPLEEDT